MKSPKDLIPILEYMNKDRNQRRMHLDLNDECFEVGGTHSYHFWGLLAYYLGTTIPTKMGSKVILCHACNNPKCSNVKHLYWGSASDNVVDMQEAGTYFSPMASARKKYGEKKARKMFEKFIYSRRGSQNPAPKEHWEKFRHAFDSVDKTKRGWISLVAKKLNVSHTHVRRIAKHLNI